MPTYFISSLFLVILNYKLKINKSLLFGLRMLFVLNVGMVVIVIRSLPSHHKVPGFDSQDCWYFNIMCVTPFLPKEITSFPAFRGLQNTNLVLTCDGLMSHPGGVLKRLSSIDYSYRNQRKAPAPWATRLPWDWARSVDH